MTEQVLMPDPYAPVELQALRRTNGNSSSRLAVVLEPEGEAKEVGIVSQDYRLVKTEKLCKSQKTC